MILKYSGGWRRFRALSWLWKGREGADEDGGRQHRDEHHLYESDVAPARAKESGQLIAVANRNHQRKAGDEQEQSNYGEAPLGKRPTVAPIQRLYPSSRSPTTLEKAKPRSGSQRKKA